MQLFSKMADRMVNSLVPAITAEAHVVCSPYSYYQDCGCNSSDQRKVKSCYVNEACETSCGACDITVTNEYC
jgi:hypothetical protein